MCTSPPPGRRLRRPRAELPPPLLGRSRSRRFRSSRATRRSTTTRSRSPAPRTTPSRHSSRPCARCSHAPVRASTISRTVRRRDGPTGELGHNCSGKHAGMLAACRAHGWPLHPYRDLAHPLQRRIAADRSAARSRSTAAGCRPSARPSPALPRSSPGRRPAFARRCARDPSSSARPDGAPDTDLMRSADGWIAKGGAEGLFCAAHEDGRGFALKTEDGVVSRDPLRGRESCSGSPTFARFP